MPELSGTFALSPRDYHFAGSAGEYGLMYNHSDKVNFIWSVADLIRDTFKRSKYQDVILPLTVLRRIDCVLQPTCAPTSTASATICARCWKSSTSTIPSTSSTRPGCSSW